MGNREELGTAGAGSGQSQGVGRGRRCVSGPAGEQGPSACFKQEDNTVMVTFFFLIALFLLLILNLILFLLENLENINAFLYIGTPKVCNVYKNEEDTSTCICIF